MRTFIIKAICTVPYEELNYNDKDCYGLIIEPFEVETCCEEGALDRYHETVPIKVLDHFEITVKEQS